MDQTDKFKLKGNSGTKTRDVYPDDGQILELYGVFI